MGLVLIAILFPNPVLMDTANQMACVPSASASPNLSKKMDPALTVDKLKILERLLANPITIVFQISLQEIYPPV